MKNSKILEVFEVLARVDKNSPDLDIAIRFKNKQNFKILKERYQDIMESLQGLYDKYGKLSVIDGKQIYNFKYTDEEGKDIDNVKEYNEELKKLMDVGTDLALTKIDIVLKRDAITGKTEALGLKINSQEMDILSDIFTFNLVE